MFYDAMENVYKSCKKGVWPNCGQCVIVDFQTHQPSALSSLY